MTVLTDYVDSVRVDEFIVGDSVGVFVAETAEVWVDG